jgi:hypothetical protein
MANVKISELPQTTRLQSTDLVASVSGSTTTKITVKNLADSLTQVSSSISASVATSAATASYVNNLIQNVIISGSLNISVSGSSNSIVANNGYVVLTQVSSSLNYIDDTAAAAGGIPLGGLYRNGNFIVIRLS